MSKIEVEEHLDYQRTFWRIQRVGWVLLALLLVASALGLLGSGGPLHREVLGAGSAFRVEHPRVQRLSSEFAARFELAGGDSLSIVLPARFFEDHRLDSWTPEPVSAMAEGDEIRFTFEGRSAILRVQPQSIGRKAITVQEAGGEIRDLTYFVLP
jgi:hypothetical protein